MMILLTKKLVKIILDQVLMMITVILHMKNLKTLLMKLSQMMDSMRSLRERLKKLSISMMLNIKFPVSLKTVNNNSMKVLIN